MSAGSRHAMNKKMTRMPRFLTAVCVSLLGGCIVHETQGYPLYQPSSPTRAPGQIARVFGPLAKVDDRDVTSLGKAFDVEPGCHVLQVRKDFLQLDTGGAARPLDERPIVFAVMMSAGYIYSVERMSVETGGDRGRFWIEVRETTPDGTVSGHPMKCPATPTAQ